MAEQPSSGGLAAEGSATRHTRLKDARKQADAGNLIALTVRDLLDWWGLSRRGYLATAQVAAELANHGLSTVPDFAAVGLDDWVALTGPSVDTEDEQETTAEQEPATEQRAATEQKETRMTGAPGPTTSDGEEDDEDEPIQGQTVGNLPSALRGWNR